MQAYDPTKDEARAHLTATFPAASQTPSLTRTRASRHPASTTPAAPTGSPLMTLRRAIKRPHRFTDSPDEPDEAASPKRHCSRNQHMSVQWQDALNAEISATLDIEAAGALLGLQSPSSTPLLTPAADPMDMYSPAPQHQSASDPEAVTADLAEQMLQLAAAAATAATATAAAAGISPAQLAAACQQLAQHYYEQQAVLDAAACMPVHSTAAAAALTAAPTAAAAAPMVADQPKPQLEQQQEQEEEEEDAAAYVWVSISNHSLKLSATKVAQQLLPAVQHVVSGQLACA